MTKTTPLLQPDPDTATLVDCLLVHTLVNLCLTSEVREPLDAQGFGRVHHRILFFVTHQPGITVNQLLAVMRVTHQNLSSPMRHLIEQGYVVTRPCEDDRRQKRNFTTAKGLKLVNRLSNAQFNRVRRAFAAAGPEAVAGFFKVHMLLLDEASLAWLERRSAPRGVGHRKLK